MARQFSSEDLYVIRNEVPLEIVISKVLKLRCEREGRYFRFGCPVCGGFHTAVNRSNNLSRCFDCTRNFNTIDMVMLCRDMGFVDSVKLLQLVYRKLKQVKSNRDKSELTPARAILEGLAGQASVPPEH